MAPDGPVFVVLQQDGDCCRLVAAYKSRADADRHALECGYGVEEVGLLSAYTPDPEDVARHAREMSEAAARENYRKEYERERQEGYRRQGNIDPATVENKRLCLCRSFSDTPMHWTNGYCQYCGGWDASAFSTEELAKVARQVLAKAVARAEADLAKAVPSGG